MAKSQVILLLDSGALIDVGKRRRVESIIRRWRSADAQFVLATPSIAEVIRGGPTDAAANRIIKAIDHVVSTTETIARQAGAMLGKVKSDRTLAAIIVATADASRVTDILTSDAGDMRRFASNRINIHAIE
jgi:predicted nucleic acid-binding protein